MAKWLSVRLRTKCLWVRDPLQLLIALFFCGSIKNLFSIDCINVYFFLIFFSIDFAQWKKLFPIDCANAYLFSIFFSIDFAGWKVWVTPHFVYCDSLTLLNLQTIDLQFYQKETQAQVFPAILKNFSEQLFIEHIWVTAFVKFQTSCTHPYLPLGLPLKCIFPQHHYLYCKKFFGFS